MEPMPRIELPLWANIILMVVVLGLFGGIVRDLFELCRMHHKD